jgi:hypothetical protein
MPASCSFSRPLLFVGYHRAALDNVSATPIVVHSLVEITFEDNHASLTPLNSKGHPVRPKYLLTSYCEHPTTQAPKTLRARSVRWYMATALLLSHWPATVFFCTCPVPPSLNLSRSFQKQILAHTHSETICPETRLE